MNKSQQFIYLVISAGVGVWAYMQWFGNEELVIGVIVGLVMINALLKK